MKFYSLALGLGWLPMLAQVTPPTLPHFPENDAIHDTAIELADRESAPPAPEAIVSQRVPVSTAQLYQQRLAALNSGRLYTRLPRHSFQSVWENARDTPTYEDWTALLGLEAKAIANGQGDNRLCITIGDSLTLWLRPELFGGGDRLWLNQGIGGDNTARIRHRIELLRGTRPDSVFLMIGVNDLIGGHSDRNILDNYDDIVRQLRTDHPNARVVVQSILPTDHDAVSNARVRSLNAQLQGIAEGRGAMFLDLYPVFSDGSGRLRPELTTDGIHLSESGYRLWQLYLQQAEMRIAREQSSAPVQHVEELHQNERSLSVGM